MMKKRMALAAMTTLGCVLGAPALAHADEAKAPTTTNTANQPHFYAGGGINLYFVNKGDAASGMPIEFVDQPSPGAFMGRLGYAFNNYVAIEVQAGVGGAHSKFEDDAHTTHGEVNVKTPWAADVVLTMPVGASGDYYLLGKAGYASTKLERELNGSHPADVDISGAEFGIGGGIRSGNWDYRMEYSVISGDATSGVLGMSILRRF
ncbi:MAG: outer membrane beta-barrel protein [Pseudomonadota bacterium]